MNNNLKKLLVAGLACAAVCTTALAAPHGGKHAPAPRPAAHHETHATKHGHHHAAPAPIAHHHGHHVHARPTPPPPPPPPAPARTVVVHEEHHEGFLTAALGALVGGLIGAAL